MPILLLSPTGDQLVASLNSVLNNIVAWHTSNVKLDHSEDTDASYKLLAQKLQADHTLMSQGLKDWTAKCKGEKDCNVMERGLATTISSHSAINEVSLESVGLLTA